MADIVNPETRSRMMSNIRGTDTKPEVVLRRALHARGLRYRKNVRGMPGTPDLLFPGKGAVLFVHGCFWHRHPGCEKATTPSSNVDFWMQKFERTMERDRNNIRRLTDQGWRVGVIWECQIGKAPSQELIEEVKQFLESDRLLLGAAP